MPARRAQPAYDERLPLAPLPRLAAWVLTVAVTALGLALLSSSTQDRLRPVTGAFLLLVALGVALVARCLRAHEVVITDRVLLVGFRPFVRRFERSSVVASAARPATGWRGYYSLRELVLEVSHERRTVVLPSDTPEVLAKALAQAQPSTPSTSSA